jgi:hypothetical protein
LHRAREERFFKGEKIVSLRKTVSPCFTFTDFDCYVSQSYYLIKTERINLKVLTAILNSSLIKFWLTYKGKMQGDIYQIDKEPIVNIPLKHPKNLQDKLIESADSIILLNKESQNFSNQFLSLLQAKFTIEKLTTKLQNWHELEFADFLKELEKARKQAATATTRGLIPLSLQEEAEWMQYFNEQKQKAQTLKSEIDRTDKEIDTMVYELYGLSEEEIEIVEQS